MISELCGACFVHKDSNVKHNCEFESSSREFIARARDILTYYNETGVGEDVVVYNIREALQEFDRQVAFRRTEKPA